jgi:hypothetical protein
VVLVHLAVLRPLSWKSQPRRTSTPVITTATLTKQASRDTPRLSPGVFRFTGHTAGWSQNHMTAKTRLRYRWAVGTN